MAHPERQDEGRWRARPWLAAFLRLAIVLVPVGLSCLATLLLLQIWRPNHFEWWYLVVLCVVAAGVGMAAERVMRKLAPLATLLRLTMLFPDRAPSRLSLARAAGSGRRLAERVRRSSDDSASEAAEKVLTLITALGDHDRRTRGHSERVRLFTDLLADELKLPARDRDRLRWAALLHDVGKLRIAPTLLNKPDRLDDDEFARIKKHPEVGAELTAPLAAWLGEWSLGIVQHHERFDGAGYPARLAGTQISRAGRMLNVVDSFETMTAARPYKKPMGTRAARAELARCAGGQFDPEYVRAFVSISLPRLWLALGPLSFLAQLPILRPMLDMGNRAAAIGGQVATAATSAATVATLGAVTSLAGVHAVVPLASTAPRHPGVHAAPLAPPPVIPHKPRSGSAHRGGVAAAPVSPAPLPSASPTSAPAPAQPTPAPATPTPTPSASSAPQPSASPSPPTISPTPSPSASPPAPTVPAAPVGVSATSGNGQVTVDWSAPADGGSPLTGYTVRAVGGAGTPPPPTLVGPDVTTVIVGNLTNGRQYTFQVTATNAVGTSTAATAHATPAGAPTAPQAVTASAGDGQVTVSWTAPAASGAPVTGYTVTPYDGNVALSATQVGPSVTTVIVGSLTNGTSYRFDVTATNAIGTSPAASANATPAGPPGPPTAVSAAAGNAQATVTWTAPADNGSPLTGFMVTPYVNGAAQTPTSVAPTVTGTTIGSLSNGTTYTFAVTATNAIGTSPAGTSGAVTPAAPPPTATVPSAPTGLTAVPGNASATVSWAAPANTGGTPLTSYTLTASTGGSVVSTLALPPTATTQLVSGLVNGTAYTFDLIATNAVGDSAAATTGPVTPTAPPGPVSGVTAVPGDSQVTVSWTAPTDTGGLALTGYVVTPVGPGGPLPAVNVPAANTSTVVSGLTNGTTYTFDVAAVNSAGTSPAVTSAPVTPLPTLGVPTTVQAAPDDSSATVWWTAPATGLISSYLVTAYDSGGSPVASTTVNSPQTAAIVTGLTNGTAYTFTVTANTSAGLSAVSSPSAAVTPFSMKGIAKPPNPQKLTVVPGVAAATVSWTPPNPPSNCPITSYLITVYNASDKPTGQTLLVSPTTTSAVITGLTTGAQYRFEVVATNVAGSSGGVKSNNVTIL